jgi:hypothetical protein
MPTKKSKKPAGSGSSPGGAIPKNENLRTERELVVIAKPEAQLRATHEGLTSAMDMDVAPLQKLLAKDNLTLEPLFEESEERLQTEAAAITSVPAEEIPDFSVFYKVKAPDEKLDAIAEQLLQLDTIEAAYVKPATEPASAESTSETAESSVSTTPRDTSGLTVIDSEDYAMINNLEASTEAPPAVTPDFTARQRYLESAPVGVNAPYAWGYAGGRGAGINIIDIEWGWRYNHEDLKQNQGGVISGTNSSDDNHGTAVLGEISGDRNTFGITGISPDARISSISLVTHATAAAIRLAANRLGAGDIILLEVQRVGPRGRYLPIEFWPDDFLAIRYAVIKGIVVVEAGANGGENLDDGYYNTRPTGFPTWWRNPFNLANPNSGAVMVGAGNPPAGIHGRNRQPNTLEPYVDRARCEFSNYGQRIDTQGWGWEVTSSGYGDLQGGSNRDTWYTDQFSGTSSASPIVVGTLACVQGVLRAKGRILLTAARARELLRSTGSPQQNGTGWTDTSRRVHPSRPVSQRIGNRPNLAQLIPLALQTRNWLGVQFRGSLPAHATQRWFTYNWPAHWHVVWTVVPTSPKSGAPQINWDVAVERATDDRITYWITITNQTAEEVQVAARYAVLGW